MRNNNYLEERLYLLWEDHFADVPRKNLVLIKFGKKSKRQLGSIRWVRERTGVKSLLKKRVDEYKEQDDKRISLITITKYFQDERIPEYVIDGTIAHELVHYVHGFHSPLQQLYKHPHKGGIVKKELIKRGLGEVHRSAEGWLKHEWRKYLLFNHLTL
jgi:hypothetical protein